MTEIETYYSILDNRLRMLADMKNEVAAIRAIHRPEHEKLPLIASVLLNHQHCFNEMLSMTYGQACYGHPEPVAVEPPKHLYVERLAVGR